ncbi:BQ2448_1956 [Microbotryum intermedium]|uniref:BQ2448_1956 protein n=1 Tax=Microbotryum intermedium TaxID=269621 RepID=A0A238FCW4_9BASI|nr:BQ2448_1956 [Microbotryum intermedium]
MASGESHSHSHSHSHSLSLSHSLSPNAHASSSSSCNTTPSSSYTPTPTNQLSDARSSEYDGPRAARDRPELCDSVWIHSEHRKLSTRYTKAFEDLATSRSDVIRLTAELASAQGRFKFGRNRLMALRAQKRARAGVAESSLRVLTEHHHFFFGTTVLATPLPNIPINLSVFATCSSDIFPVFANVFAPPLPAPTSAAPSPVSVSTPISPNDLFAAMKASFAARPSPASGTNSNSNRPPSRRESALPSPTEYSASQSPLPLSASQGPGSGRSKYYNAPTLPSRPPDPRVVNQYLVKLGSWTRPRYDYTQLIHVHNYGNNAAVKSNLRTEMVDLDGACPTPAEWKLWIADRLTIVRDLLYPGKSWKNQRNQDKRLAVQVVEKRFPALALCEPDRCWKAAIFLQRRLDEAIKMGHESERRKGANSVNNTLGMSIGPLPVCQGLTW